MPVQTQSQEPQIALGVQNILALPQSLLEMVLISGTNTKNKKALRQTCKAFREALDGRLQQLGVMLSEDEDAQHLGEFLGRIQHIHGLSIVTLASCNVGSLLDHLPHNLVMLRLFAWRMSLEPLSRLRHLKSLDVMADACVTGLQTISGLTSLHCYRWHGSLAHLAPTLKRLCIWNYDTRMQVEELTNLEALTMQKMPHNFFPRHSKLPLKHLHIRDKCCNGCMNDANVWQPAPRTLTGLTLYGTPNISLTVIPVTITHLQLLDAYDVIDQALTTLPQLKRLDVSLKTKTKHAWDTAFNNLCKHTNLQELGMCVVQNEAWQRDQVLSELPEIAKAVGRGVRLNVVDRTDGLLVAFKDPYNLGSEWSTYT